MKFRSYNKNSPIAVGQVRKFRGSVFGHTNPNVLILRPYSDPNMKKNGKPAWHVKVLDGQNHQTDVWEINLR